MKLSRQSSGFHMMTSPLNRILASNFAFYRIARGTGDYFHTEIDGVWNMGLGGNNERLSLRSERVQHGKRLFNGTLVDFNKSNVHFVNVIESNRMVEWTNEEYFSNMGIYRFNLNMCGFVRLCNEDDQWIRCATHRSNWLSCECNIDNHWPVDGLINVEREWLGVRNEEMKLVSPRNKRYWQFRTLTYFNLTLHLDHRWYRGRRWTKSFIINEFDSVLSGRSFSLG